MIDLPAGAERPDPIFFAEARREDADLRTGTDGGTPRKSQWARWIVMFGPGLLVMLADTDAGNIVTAADAGARWGYRLLPLPLLLIPLLAVVQELAVRIGIFSGGGFGDLLRKRCHPMLRHIAALALVSATVGSLMTEMTGIAGVGELYGISRLYVLPLTGALLLIILFSGEYRRVERIAIALGLFELGFVVIAWVLHPSFQTLAKDITRQPLSDPGYLYLGAALFGATFNPWMIFYQASALVELRADRQDYAAARWDTWAGATLTQILTAAVLVASAAAISQGPHHMPLIEVGQISQILEPVLGETYGRLVFGLGVVGASLAAAIVCSLACVWGVGELYGRRGSMEKDRRRPWFISVSILTVTSCATIVLLVNDLVWLSVGLQVLNAVLMPFIVTLLLVMAATALPDEVKLRGPVLWIVAVTVAVVSIAGLVGAYAGLM